MKQLAEPDKKVLFFIHQHLPQNQIPFAGSYHKIAIGRGRELVFGCVGTTNEICFLVDDRCSPKHSVCIHNYDYDGYLTWEKLGYIIKLFVPQLSHHFDQSP